MGNIQKCGKWVTHEVTERQMENRKTICEILLAIDRKENFFCIELLLVMKSGIILRILNARNHGLHEVNQQN